MVTSLAEDSSSNEAIAAAGAAAEVTTDADPQLDPALQETRAWKVWEQDVAVHLKMIDGLPHTVLHDEKRMGNFSKVLRQIDVLVEREWVDSTFRIVVECKAYKRKLDVGKVDEFLGKLLDVGADKGLLYAIRGATPGARNRASSLTTPPRIEIRDVEYLDAMTKGLEEEARKSNKSISLAEMLASTIAEDEWIEDAADALGYVKCPQPRCYNDAVATVDEVDGMTTGWCGECGSYLLVCPDCSEVLALEDGTNVCYSCSAQYDASMHSDGGVTALEQTEKGPDFDK